MQLAVEAPEMATRYDKKSVAEQNSLDLSWEILMEDRFAKLRSFVFETQEELLRFRQLIVNIVLATGSCGCFVVLKCALWGRSFLQSYHASHFYRHL